MTAQSSVLRLRGVFIAFTILFFFLYPWTNTTADAMGQEELRARQSQELDSLREEFRQKALAAGGNKEQLERLNRQYSERFEATRQKYLGSDTRGNQIKEIEAQSKGDITNTGSPPKDVRADVDLAAKSHQAASNLAKEWRARGDVVHELPDGMGYVNKTHDMTLWNPCETAACMEAKIKYHDAHGTEGGRAGTKVPGAVEDPRGWFLDNQKKFIHAVGEGDLKTVAKTVDKAATAAGIKDPNDPFWQQAEKLRNYGDPVKAGIADLTDTPAQQKTKVQEWMRQAQSRLHSAGEKLPQRTTFDDPDAKTRVEEGNVKTDVENIRSRGGMESRGPSEERIRKGLSAGQGVDAPGKGAVVKGVAAGVVTGVVMGAAVSYIICMEEVGDHATCMEVAKEAMSGEAIAWEVFWGAVAATGPQGVAAAAAYGAYHGAKQIVILGEEGVAGIRDLLDRERERRAREAQQQKNLKNMEATISSLERELGGELDGLMQNRMAVHRLACEKADEAKRITEGLASFVKGLEGHDAELANASTHCKDVERLMTDLKTRADNAKRYAGLAETGFDWIRKQINACVSSGDVTKAIESVGSARGLAKGAAQNYSQAQDALATLRRIRSESERMRGALSRVEGLPDAAYAKLLEADRVAMHAKEHGFMADDLDQQIKKRKDAMLGSVRSIRDSLIGDETQSGSWLFATKPGHVTEVEKRFKPLMDRLTAEEPHLNTKSCVDSAWAQAALAQEMWKQAKARVDGLKSIPLCDTIAIPEGLVDDAARAIASMGLGGLGEGIEEQAKSCLARLKSSKEKEEEKAEQAKKKEQERVEEAKNRATAVANEVDALYADAKAALAACDFERARVLIDQMSQGKKKTELEKEYRASIEHEDALKAMVGDANGHYNSCNFDKALPILKNALSKARCQRHIESIKEKISKVQGSIGIEENIKALVRDAEGKQKNCSYDETLTMLNEASSKAKATCDKRIEQINGKIAALRKDMDIEEHLKAQVRDANSQYENCDHDMALATLNQALKSAKCSEHIKSLTKKIAIVQKGRDYESKTRVLHQEAKGLYNQGRFKEALDRLTRALDHTRCERFRTSLGEAIALVEGKLKTSPEEQVAKKDCSRYGKAEAYWDEGNQKAECRCKPGFKLDEKICAPTRETLVKGYDCSKIANSYAKWDEGSNQPLCFCNPGYEWNSTKTACVSVAERQREMEWWQAECARLSSEVAEMESLYKDHETGERLSRAITLPNSNILMYDRIKSLDRAIKQRPKDDPASRPLTEEFIALRAQFIVRMNQLIAREADLSTRGIRDYNALLARWNGWKSVEARYLPAKAERDRACEKAAASSRRSFQTN